MNLANDSINLHSVYITILSLSLSLVYYNKDLSTRNKINQKRRSKIMCNSEGDCRPLGFLLGLPFALLSLLLSIVGVIIWIVGLLLTCICPCCLCVTIVVELALELIKAPIHVIKWFTSKIPC